MMPKTTRVEDLAAELSIRSSIIHSICQDKDSFYTGEVIKSGGTVLLDEDAVEEVKEILDRIRVLPKSLSSMLLQTA